MSTPAAPEGFLSRVSHWTLAFFLWVFFLILGVAVVASIVASLDWQSLMPALTELALVLGFLYWVSTLLPGPVKKVARIAGRGVVGMVKRNADKRPSRR
jgi:hypothetical protein